jgi:S1-C subfamily serine protease
VRSTSSLLGGRRITSVLVAAAVLVGVSASLALAGRLRRDSLRAGSVPAETPLAVEQGDVGPGRRSDRTTSRAAFRYVAAALAGAAMTLGAYTFGSATGDGSTATTTTTAAAAAPDPTTTSTAAPTTTTTTTSTTSTSAAPALAEEPVARAAAVAGPAVVQIETAVGLGSGVIYTDDGHVLTAAHVIDTGIDFVTVRLADGREFDGTVLGRHEPTDIAVVLIEDAAQLPVAELALGSPVRIGQLAVALGSPFGLDQTVTAGIVSAVDRVVDDIAMIQTDAAINPGNSGGPLLDSAGRVIGINDMIFSVTGGNQGVGFAIAIDLAVVVAEQIVAGEEVGLAYLGITVSNETGNVPGALIDRISVNSPAAEAGLERNDIIVSIDGAPVNGRDTIRARVVSKRPGDEMTVEYVRDGQRATTVVVLASTNNTP